MRRRYLLLPLLAAALVAASGCGAAATPRADRGVLDLSDWDVQSGGPVPLTGDWQLYWGALLTPAELAGRAPTGYLAVPSNWTTAGLPRDGFATLHLRVRLPAAGARLALSMPVVCSAYRLWVNGEELAGDGAVGTTAAAETPQFLPRVVRFTPRGDTLAITIQVSNFHHRCAGIRYAPRLGSEADVNRASEAGLAFSLFLFGAILIMALYHLGLYLLRRDERSALYFGLFCLLIAVRTLLTGDLTLIRLWPSFPWGVEQRLEYLTDYLGLPSLYLFLAALYPREVSRFALRAAAAVGLAGAATLVLPVRQASLLIPPYEAVLMFFVAYAVSVLVRAVRLGRDGAWLFFVGGCCFFAALVNDFLVYNHLIVGTEWLPAGLFVLIVAQSVVLAQRFATAFTELRRSRRMVTEGQERLRKEIAEMLHGRVQTRLLLAGQGIAEAERRLPAAQEGVRTLLAQARREIDEVREEDVRRASHLLHPSIIDVGLVPAARSLCDRFADHLPIDLVVDPRLEEQDAALQGGIPEGIRLAAYRVLEEALNNVCAHAAARRAEVEIRLASDGGVELRVRDDGRGFDPARVAPGLGLRSIDARVEEMGGRWGLDGRPGDGTVLTAWLPLS